MNIGTIQLNQPVALAPMEDVTDLAFRRICKRFGADLLYTEFTSSEALIRDIPKALKKIMITDEERPVGIQIFGARTESMEVAARMAEKLQPDLIDINCGCWVKNHAQRNEGAGLLRDLALFERIVRSTVKSTKLPVTVKTRLGWDQKSIVILEVAKMVEQSGAQALTVHCRTRSQAHKGEADWEWLPKIKKVIKIPLIGNGDVTTPQDAKAMLETGCDGIMIGRGAVGNPWLFEQTKHYLATGELLEAPSLEERIKVCIDHLKLAIQLKGLRDGVITFRKFYAGYLKGLPRAAKIRSRLMQLVDQNAVIDTLYQSIDELKKCA